MMETGDHARRVFSFEYLVSPQIFDKLEQADQLPRYKHGVDRSAEDQSVGLLNILDD